MKVLDKGSVELIDSMKTDPLLKIVNAARVSFAKEVTELGDKDLKLIQYLVDHGHTSTLRHSYFTFRIKAPLCVFRQWWKYQVGSEWIEGDVGSIEIPDTSWNEASGRYVEFKPEFYIPEVFRRQSSNNKQGSDGNVDNQLTARACFEVAVGNSFAYYQHLVKQGVAKEQARMVLPQNLYSECIWTVSLQTVMFFLSQRLKEDAQWEIREYAKAIRELMVPSIGQIL